MATCLVSRSSQRRCHGNQSSASRRDNFSNRNQSKNCFFSHTFKQIDPPIGFVSFFSIKKTESKIMYGQRRCHGNQSSASRRDNFSNRNQSKNCFFSHFQANGSTNWFLFTFFPTKQIKTQIKDH